MSQQGPYGQYPSPPPGNGDPVPQPGQYPPSPYSAPPAAGAQPGQYPVSAAPVTVVPGGSPPPQPPRKKISAGWVVGGVCGTLAVILAVYGTLVAAGVFGSTQKSNQAVEGEPEPETEYVFVEDMCSQLDTSSYEIVATLESPLEQESEEPGEEDSHSACSASFVQDDGSAPAGQLYASGSRWKTTEEAEADASGLEDEDGYFGELDFTPLEGEWRYGTVGTRVSNATGEIWMVAYIQDGKFVTIVDMTLFGGTESQMENAVVGTATEILELSRALWCGGDTAAALRYWAMSSMISATMAALAV